MTDRGVSKIDESLSLHNCFCHVSQLLALVILIKMHAQLNLTSTSLPKLLNFYFACAVFSFIY